MSDWLSQFYSQPRLRAVLLSAFAGLGLLLCAIGIFGVLSQSVTQRRHEIGIRMALGAQSRDILRSIPGQGARMTLTGIAIGVLASLGLSRLMTTMLYGVTATDPLTPSPSWLRSCSRSPFLRAGFRPEGRRGSIPWWRCDMSEASSMDARCTL